MTSERPVGRGVPASPWMQLTSRGRSVSVHVLGLAAMCTVLLPPLHSLALAEVPGIGRIYMPDLALALGFLAIVVLTLATRASIAVRVPDLIMVTWALILSIRSLASGHYAALGILVYTFVPYVAARLTFDLESSELVGTLRRWIVALAVLEFGAELFAYYVGPIFAPVEGSFLFTTGQNAPIRRAMGTVGHPIPLGVILSVGLLAALGRDVDRRANGGRNVAAFWRYILVFGFAFGIIITYARSAWIACLVGLGVFIHTGVTRRRQVPAVFLVMGSMLVIMSTSIGEAMAARLSSLADSISLSHRLLMLDWGVENWLRSASTFLVGHGIGGTHVLLRSLAPADGLMVVDNQYVALLNWAGVLGIVFAVGVLIGPTVRCIRNRYVPWVSAAMATILVAGLAFEFLGWRQMAVLLSIFAGLQVSRCARIRGRAALVHTASTWRPVVSNGSINGQE